MMALSRNWTIVCGVALCTSLVGCGGGKDDFKSAKDVQKDRAGIIKEKAAHHDEHHHHAPHHGSLTMLGEHAAQIELSVDAAEGKLTVYILDGEAAKSQPVDQADLEVSVTPDGATEPVTLKLVPADAAKQDDGFTAQNDKLKGVTKLKGTLTSLKLKGKDKADEKIAVEFDAKKAEEEAEEAHKDGHKDEHGHDEHKVEGKFNIHEDHDEKDHKHADDEHGKEEHKDEAAPAAKKAE
jgi:hypothetical protein